MADLVGNKDMLGEWNELNQAKRDIADRIRKMEQRRDEVKPQIYDKVLRDYTQQLREIDEQIEPLLEKISQQKDALAASKAELIDRLAKPQDKLDELQFRFELGEFDQAELRARGTEFDAELRHLREQIARLDEQLEGLGGGVDVSDLDLAEAATPPPVDIEDPRHNVDQSDIDAMFDEISNAPIQSEPKPAAAPPPPPPPPPPPSPPPPPPPPPPAPVEEEPVVLSEVVAEAAEQMRQTMPEIKQHALAPPAPPAPPAQPAHAAELDDLSSEFFTSKPGAAAPKSTRAVVLHEPGGKETVFPLEEITLVGSDVRCEVMIEDKSVERKHARISFEKDGCHVKDLGSRQGTFVNGKKVKKAKLVHQDVLKIGDIKLTVKLR